MTRAAEEDDQALLDRLPALSKLAMLDTVCTEICKPKWVHWYIKEGVCQALGRWEAFSPLSLERHLRIAAIQAECYRNNNLSLYSYTCYCTVIYHVSHLRLRARLWHKHASVSFQSAPVLANPRQSFVFPAVSFQVAGTTSWGRIAQHYNQNKNTEIDSEDASKKGVSIVVVFVCVTGESICLDRLLWKAFSLYIIDIGATFSKR